MQQTGCQHCGRKLGMLERWRHGHFCSPECKQAFEQESARLAVQYLEEFRHVGRKRPEPEKPVRAEVPKKTEAPPKKDAQPEPEPAMQDFSDQVEPEFVDAAVRALGFPPAGPVSKGFRLKEEAWLGLDKVPERVMRAREE